MKRILVILVYLSACMLGFAAVLSFTSCKLTPESQRAVTEKVQVPGLKEELKARDLAIAAAIAIAWKSDPELAQNKLEVEVVSARAIIRGRVPTEELKKRAEEIARNTEDVKDVLNEIVVDPKLKDERISLEDI